MKNGNFKKEMSMTKRYPFVILVEMLFLCDKIQNNDVLYLNGQPITYDKMSKVLKIKRNRFNKAFHILEYYNLCRIEKCLEKGKLKKYIKLNIMVKKAINRMEDRKRIIKNGKGN